MRCATQCRCLLSTVAAKPILGCGVAVILVPKLLVESE
ncbi:hypothetical protein PI124_g19522 [Phytophthora idaei]|nr:hypothetical protein PI125_g20567 [Phytophthora idaei]KAG3235442.1 hypothetical protein PI124_g19522 [Phytophthora idaei]